MVSKSSPFLNSHYDSYCYLPMVCFLTFNEEAEQYLVAAVLQAWKCDWFGGCGGDSAPSDCTGERGFSRENPVCLDGGFACPEVLDFLDYEPKVEYPSTWPPMRCCSVRPSRP